MKRRTPNQPDSAKLVIAVMWKESFLQLADALADLVGEFGGIVSETAVFKFNHTAYYEPEMGVALFKKFLEVEGLHPRDCLPDLKHAALVIEEKYGDGNIRNINIDPMLVCLENVVIATTKNFPHRAYLGRGIYADVHLYRNGGQYKTLPWTYKDYLEHLDFFEKVRAR